MKNKPSQESVKTTRLHISGLVQGVGFRPFVYRLATGLKLNGKVYNQNNGVVILLQGEKLAVEKLQDCIKPGAPKTAEIVNIDRQVVYEPIYSEFSIDTSQTIDNSITRVSPDIAVCESCLDDMKRQPRRLDYPFTNCTHCGPRFSIIENIPYDRPFTSMKDFKMCPGCEKEYSDISDRRFHAQPIACNNCGPTYSYYSGKETITAYKEILDTIKTDLESGKVIAIKGIGGFHLACDAFNHEAILDLRKIKKRDKKPFALMAKDIGTARKYAVLSEKETEALTSWQRPIVLAEQKMPHVLSEEIANGLNTIGLFLPYMPFHYKLFEHTGKEIFIMTSANLSDCPIITENTIALKSFLPLPMPVLLHNRKIVNRVDDSIVQDDALGLRIIRRSRGYTPRPVTLNIDVEGILATGAELTGAFCIGRHNQAIMSPYIGDIKNSETMEFFEQAYGRMKKLFRFTPKVVACDMHPDYLSTAFANTLGITVVPVQHHHAHIASCMAEYGIDEPVIGVAYDGTGFGTDGKTWGSEIMIATQNSFERIYHFEYVPIPGGDKATEEPWRSAFSYLHKAYNGNYQATLKIFENINPDHLKMAETALTNKINTPESCSAGRLFDAVSALLGVCKFSTYHAEAPLNLEHSVTENIDDCYDIELKPEISWNIVIRQIVADLNNKTATGIIAAKFHNTVAEITTRAILQLHFETGISKAILSGGTFQNRYLIKKTVGLLKNKSILLYLPSQLPPNDGGIALGQMVIAAKQQKICFKIRTPT
ncbi:MAG: carbamoyltransferase HypF [Bacteroidales bacterium]|nr:carbamoyltransferase HypF [Bacteroidales bacterium]